MWDLEPDAPVGIRGEFRPIATSVPGIRICEHLPKTARWMHKAAIVRSGIDPEMTVQDRAGQPIAIARGGKPIREIIA